MFIKNQLIILDYKILSTVQGATQLLGKQPDLPALVHTNMLSGRQEKNGI